jgi:hypothetical protein
MGEGESGDMSRDTFQVAYDGPDDTHSMDVQELAPALLAFGRLVREANWQLNAKKATVKVLVTSDFEHKCFNINFEVLQTILHQLATFFQSDEVKTARQILVDLGIIGGTGGLGLFGFLKWKNGREVAEVRDAAEPGIVIVQLGDGNSAHISRGALALADNPKVRTAVEGALAPLGSDGIRKIAFRQGAEEIASYDEADAKQIVSSFGAPETVPVLEDEVPDTLTAWLRVYSPVYDEKATKWRFYYGDHPIYADISETTIAKAAIERGGALVNDLYKVKMEVKQHVTAGGDLRPEYKIVEVLDFQPAAQQVPMRFEPPSGGMEA